MNLGRHTILAFAALILCMVAAPVLAAGEPDVGQARWANPENARAADNGETVYRCGTDESGPKHILSPDVRAQIDRLIAEGKVAAGGNIPVYVHVIYTSREGNVSDAAIAAQIQVLNYNYAGRDYNGNPVSGAASTGYTFTLAGTDRRNSSKWFKMTPGSSAEIQAKNALAINPGGALNLYTCKPGQNLLGWSVFPWMSQAGTNQDGVVIHYGSLPGGYLSPYNLGGTATHEIGHYLGLYHTFQGGCDTGTCDASGDLVCDTPAEASATSGCPGGKDTCPATGLDPIHNYMDYSTDICYTNFTSGQDTRMNQQVLAYSTRSWIGATRYASAATQPGYGTADPGNSNYRGRDFSERKADNGEYVYRCATDESGPKHVLPPDVRAQIDRWLAEGRVSAGGNIPVHVHVITGRRGAGAVSDADIAEQIQVLNYHYAGRYYDGSPISGAANTGYTFTLASTERTNSSKWFGMTPGSKAERDAKNALAINPGGSLNLYTCSPGQNLLGWAVFPWTSQAGTNQDGVVIHYGSLPNGYLSPYNLGGTASHEIGHYLGLYHTFQGGCDTGTCDTSGDLVCDTPAEATATSGCPGGKDTCPAAGLDPIHNYMDYSTDACYDNFTNGQDARMNVIVNAYRGWVGNVRVAYGAGSLGNARAGADFGFRVSPNPFNPRTKIEFATARDGRVSVRVFDVQGRLVSTVVDRELPRGAHSYTFDGDRLSSGIYWMRLEADGRQLVRRISLLK